MANGLEFLNLEEFLARFTAALPKLEEDGGLVLEATAHALADDARGLAAIGTGEEDVPGLLRDSIDVQTGVDDKGPYVAVGSFGVRYAVYQEFGTSKMPAHPFLRPAMAAAKLTAL